MKIIAPDYYTHFRCIADKCRNTCCVGWEIDIDDESLSRFIASPDIASHIETEGTPHIILSEGERCPFLNSDGLCDMIISHGENFLCGICRDHPRFRNFFSDRTEIGVGLVCEEAARLILGQSEPMKLTVISDDGAECEPDEDEEWLIEYRDSLIKNITESGAKARLLEYLYYRHLPDALYDGRVEARVRFVIDSFDEICEEWERTDKSTNSLAECSRRWSYDVEYDEEELERRLSKNEARLFLEKKQ